MDRSPSPQSTTLPPDEGASEVKRKISIERALTLLARGDMGMLGLLPGSSNYTFLAHLSDGELEALAVYKPQRGERPLWDFADGTLCLREMAAFLLSQMLGWPDIPPTVLREGPHGLGVVQLYIDADPEAHYLTFAEERPGEGQRIALFDLLANNADRKSGHCLLDSDGRVWSIDHGITFHSDYKLRTVIWEFAGQPIPVSLLVDLRALQARLATKGPEVEALSRLLSRRELEALRRRLNDVLTTAKFPEPGSYRSVPWPPV